MSGLFISMESFANGAGDSKTQYRLLAERLKSLHYDVKEVKFSEHNTDASYFVRKYINDEYGAIDELGPYTPSLFYALDRYDASKQIQRWLAEGSVVLADRYIGSDKILQGSKLDDVTTRQAYYTWLDPLEFGMLGIPRPDVTFLLSVSTNIAQPVTKNQTYAAMDSSHGTNTKELERVVAIHQELGQLYPKEYALINCLLDGELMSIPAINNLIWGKIQPMLKNVFKKKTPPQTKQLHPMTPKSEDPSGYNHRNSNGTYGVTKSDHEKLNAFVTNTEKNVYAFTGNMNSETVATAMVRSSQRFDDMRITLVDEFIDKEAKEITTLSRTIATYDSNSIQQLTGLHFGIENASSLLARKLQKERLSVYTAPSLQYIYSDKKSDEGSYKYYVPSTFDDATAEDYRQKMNHLFSLYSKLVSEMTDYVRANSSDSNEKQDEAWKLATRAQASDVARLVLPTAATATVGLYATEQALESLVMCLQSDEMSEAREVGDELLAEARKVVPTLSERPDSLDRNKEWIAHRAQTSKVLNCIAKDKELQPYKGESGQSIVLTDYWPKNELDTLPHMLYTKSTLSLNQLNVALGDMPYQEKQSLYSQYFGDKSNRHHKPGRALEAIHYNFDLICNYDTFSDLQRYGMVDTIEWQQLTPNYGFETPELIISAGLEDLFESCFAFSQKLYQSLYDAGYEYESQYATLLGHKMRWNMTINAREAFHFSELGVRPQSRLEYHKLVELIHGAIATVHPLTAEGMVFANKEDATS